MLLLCFLVIVCYDLSDHCVFHFMRPFDFCWYLWNLRLYSLICYGIFVCIRWNVLRLYLYLSIINCRSLLVFDIICRYMLMFVSICWYMLILLLRICLLFVELCFFGDLCWYVLMFVAICWYLLIFVDSCWSPLFFYLRWYFGYLLIFDGGLMMLGGLVLVIYVFIYLLLYIDIGW